MNNMPYRILRREFLPEHPVGAAVSENLVKDYIFLFTTVSAHTCSRNCFYHTGS